MKQNHAAELLKELRFAARRAEERAAGRVAAPVTQNQRRPRYWLCPACGNRLQGDQCRFHRLDVGRLVREHVLSPDETRGCRCAFCERAAEYMAAGHSREEAARAVAADCYPPAP